MARIHTHYDNLKVARNAPPEVIRAAFKTLSQKYHPDRNPDHPDAVRIIQCINLAYEVLSDPVKRQEHDAWISEKEEQLESKRSRPEIFFPKNFYYQPRPRRSKRRRSFFRHGHWLVNPAAPVLKAMQKMQNMLYRFSKYLSKKA